LGEVFAGDILSLLKKFNIPMIEQIPYDYTNKEHVKVICDLHKELLPESLLPKMGKFFMSKFYYAVMTKEGWLDGYLYKHNGKYIAFFTGTDVPFTFLQEARKKYFWRISFVTIVALLTKPSRIKYLTQKSRITSDTDSKVSGDLNALKDKYQSKIGEFVSFGVVKDYRRFEDEATKLKVPHLIMNQVFGHFREHNKICFIGVVMKSNINAIKFYEKYNTSYEIVEGDPSESFVMTYFT